MKRGGRGVGREGTERKERKKGKEIGYRIEQIESFEVLQEKEIPQ